MFGLGRVESARGNWPAAIEATEAALAVAERLGRAVEEYLCHQLLSQINERAGNFEPALWHFQRFYELESATRSSENGSRLARLEVEHQIQAARKDAEIMRLRSIALEREVEDRRVTLAALEAQASLDALTGLFNRWHVDVLMNEVNKAITSGIEVSLIVFDVDEFKEVNDQFGHAAGDRVLTAVSAELRKNARRSDIPCRWGGDEFIMLLVDMDRVSAGQVAERLCAAVADTPVASEGALIPFTLSAGVASADPDGPTDFDSLLKDADIALYTAKEEGRNRVVVRDA
jgi:diguanylate cyclase (GGDEF)-like protein